MLRQKKNLNIKKVSSSFKNWSKKQIRKNKIRLRSRKIFKNKPQIINQIFQQFASDKGHTNFQKQINIRITPNNIFCTLKNLLKNKTLKVCSSGTYKVKTSKKTLRYSTKVVVGSFLEDIKNDLNSNKFIVNVTGPIKIRKGVLKQLSKYLKKSSVVININDKKCFNGCRPPKKRRKKQKGLRIFK
jgi:ribosomal protein S11